MDQCTDKKEKYQSIDRESPREERVAFVWESTSSCQRGLSERGRWITALWGREYLDEIDDFNLNMHVEYSRYRAACLAEIRSKKE